MDRLSETDIGNFIREGFIRMDSVVPSSLCREIRDILWKDMGLDEHNPASWTKPVVRLWEYSQEPFRKAANMPALLNAFDQLVGPGRWLPRGSLGSFPVRFPSREDPGDTGWHVDASFAGDDPGDIFSWRINVHSKGRALLMLFLFSDVSEKDAPTRISRGSHRHIARMLSPYGEAGLSFLEVAEKLPQLPVLPEALATGAEGTVYLCHPFLSHAAQPHRGTYPKFMAQPPLLLREPLALTGSIKEAYPLERAIMESLKE